MNDPGRAAMRQLFATSQTTAFDGIKNKNKRTQYILPVSVTSINTYLECYVLFHPFRCSFVKKAT